MEPTSSEWVEKRGSKIHGYGLFAAKDIPKGTKVIEYVGEKISKEEGDKRSEDHLELAEKDPSLGGVYVFELDETWDIDGSPDWNTAKYANHSCDPNSEADFDIDPGHIWIVAMNDIKAGDEITYNYSYDLEDIKDYPCRCGTEKCVGYILDEELWEKLPEMLAKK